MQSSVRLVAALVLLTSALASAYLIRCPLRNIGLPHRPPQETVLSFLHPMTAGPLQDNSAKLRRDGVLNLYPFPRVGRANRHTWQVPHNEMYLDYEPIEKRQLYAFPRVGRSDLSLLREPVAEPLHVRRSDTNGMWFGPRVGRSFKSEDDDITFQNESSDRSEPELMEPVHEEREKRHTKQN